MNKTLTYLFDPLCGWCYGAGGPLPQVLEQSGLTITLVPTGLFAGAGARPMSREFAAYAWANDQRIERLTGQVFSERYRTHVLADESQAFDSGPATVALTAVAQVAPEREFEALKAIQHARYVDGANISRLGTLADIIAGMGLAEVADHLRQPDAALVQLTHERMQGGRALLGSVGVQGVPTFILDKGGKRRVLNASAIFSNPQAFASELSLAG